MPKKKNWIAGATENKGGLHRSLGVPEGEKIPAKKLEVATHSDDPKVRKQANLAKTLKGMR
jgi:hypothetical protein